MDLIVKLFSSEYCNVIMRFIICICVNGFIIEYLYYRKCRRRDFYFTFMLISVAIFFLVYFMMGMDRGKATMGVGLGLFGIFSIMRYRTDTMPVREMTYLFIIVCLSVVHAMVNVENKYIDNVTDFGKLAAMDCIVILLIYMCEKKLKIQHTKLVQYDRIELIKPERYDELVADLKERTGLDIKQVEVGGIDFLKDAAVLRITYADGEAGHKDIDRQFKVTKSQWKNIN